MTAEELAAVSELIKKHTRNYAKRQLTWFRRYAFAASFDVGDFDAAERYVAKRLEECGRDDGVRGGQTDQACGAKRTICEDDAAREDGMPQA